MKLLLLAATAAGDTTEYCASLVVNTPSTAADPDCPATMGPATRYALETCTDELCALMTTGVVALGFDEESKALRKVGTTCSIGSFTGTPDAFACSVNPPYLQYSQNYDIDFLPDYAYVYDVAVQSNTSDLAFAAGTELTVLRMKANGRFERIGRSPIYHYGVQSSQFVDGLVFATQSSAFAILDVTNPSIPKEYTVPIDGYSCATMGEYKTSTAHVVYVGCPYYGVWPVDVSTTTKPVMLGNGTASLFYEIGWETSLIRGLLVDSDRDLLFSAWTSYQVGIRMSDLKTDKEYPTLLDHYENISPYRMMLRGTVLYAATTSGLEVLETVNRKLESLSSCCDDGPILNLRGVTMYGEYLYASDYNGRIVVMNATNPTQPTYAAHKDFPAEMGTYAYGGEGIVASAFSDGSVRIMQAASSNGFLVWSDLTPAATPIPETFIPAPPALPMDCSHVSAHVGVECPEGKALIDSHMLNLCTASACATLPDTTSLAVFDGPSVTTYVYKTSTGSCSTKFVSGATPAYSMCGEDYVDYVAVRPAENDKDVLFALRQSGFDIVALTPPQSPKVLTSVKIDAPYSCVAMDQIRRGALVHVVFASCKKYGVYGIDVRDNANPVLLNNGAPVMQPLSGVAKGIATDEDRKLLFVTTIESGASLYMYDVTDPSKPTTVSSLSVQFDAHGVTRAGTLLYIAASDKMYVYESKDKALSAVGSCCTNAAAMDLYGGTLYEDVYYGSDYKGKLVMMNVSEPTAPFYIGHKNVAQPPVSWQYPTGREGVVVSALGDGIVRVFQAAYSTGLMVYSDEKPPPTPAPPTPMPPPPVLPPDCSELSIHVRVAEEYCDTGDVRMSAAMIDTCGATTLCALMPDNTEAGFDSSDETYTKTASVCSIRASSTKPNRFVCGPPPPLTLFVVQYDQDFFPDYTSVRGWRSWGRPIAKLSWRPATVFSSCKSRTPVASKGSEPQPATTTERLPPKHSPGVFYGLRSSYLDLFIMDDPTSPTLKKSINWWGYSCASLKEYKQGSDVFVYVSCPSYGVWAVNVTDISNPALTTSQGDGFFEPVDGDTRGLAVDTDRGTYYPSDNNVYEVAVSDGKIYAAAQAELEVYDFVNNEFVALTSCCSHGPKLDLRGVTIYGDLAYLSDYNAKLVVMNVSSALSSPYYIGHRDLPSDSGSMAGQAGVVVTMLGDGQMHVLQAGYSAGLMTFSDVEPGPTPAPPTPLPPPPVEPMDCSHVFVEATSTRCPDGFVLMNEHLIESCFDDSLCAKLTAGVVYKCDTTTGVAVVKTGTQCFFSDLPASEPSQALCGTPPPYTTYSRLHKVLDTYSYARDLDIMGSAGKEIVLAHTDGVSVFSAEHSTGFELRGTYPGYFYSVMAAAHNADLVYAGRYGTIELVSFSPPTAPRKVSAVDITNPWPTCYHMEQLYVKSEGLHVLYLSCGYRGLYGVDVSDDNNLVVLNNGQKLLSPANGDIQGLFVDLPRRFLFAVSDTAAAEVYMFNVSNAEKPMRLSSYELESPGIAIVVEGTVAYAAGQEKVEIFETNTMAFVPISWCCQQAPDMNLRGITWYNGLLYASDSSPRLFVMNVTDPTLPYYDGHREISEGGTTSSNPQRIKVGKLADNVMRVFQVVYSSGFVVYSDEVPPPTPAPPTPLPPPPIIPPDCSQLYVFDTSTVTDDSVCNEGHVLLSEHIIEACDEACDAMSDGWIVNFDGQAGQVYKKTGTSCTFEDGGDQTRKLCGPPPPLTAYKTDIDDGYFQSTYASIYSVLLLGDARSEFLVAHSDGMTVVTLNNEGLFNPMTQYESTNTYYDLQIMMGENAVVIAARAYGIDILDVSNLLKPKKIGSAEGNGYSCYDLAQYQTATSHTVYEGCDYSGVYIYDATDKTKPAKKGSALVPSSGDDIGGVLVDNSRAALFITVEYWSSKAGIYLYNLTTSPLNPEYVSFTETDVSCFDMVMVGTTLYVAGETQLLIYDTSDLASWVQLGFCCHFGPELDIQSLDVYSGMVYAADYDGRLIVMNVTDPQAPYYLGHHELTSSYAARKVVVGTLKDNVQRVFAANDYYGLSILTDVEPPPTPAPPTPFPPPPMPPMDCSNTQLVSYVSTGDSCPKGMIVIPDHFAGICATTICDQLTATDFVEIDYFSNYYYVKDGTTCKRVYDSTGYPTKTFCIVPPAHMTYKEGHTEVLATSANAYDVAILGYDSNDVVVATDKGLTVLRGAQSTGLVKVGHVDGDYVAVIAAEHT
ncbi:hypothetical protein DIPPA_17508, partial [Diplonema papillatum]